MRAHERASELPELETATHFACNGHSFFFHFFARDPSKGEKKIHLHARGRGGRPDDIANATPIIRCVIGGMNEHSYWKYIPGSGTMNGEPVSLASGTLPVSVNAGLDLLMTRRPDPSNPPPLMPRPSSSL